MAGAVCGNCGELTAYKTSFGRKCTKCKAELIVPTGSKGKGKKCPNCKKFTFHGNQCSSPDCGATLKVPKR